MSSLSHETNGNQKMADGPVAGPIGLSWNNSTAMFSTGAASDHAPAVCAHAGRIWCAFTEKNGKGVYYASWQQGSTYFTNPVRVEFSGAGVSSNKAPSIAEAFGNLYMVVNAPEDNSLVCYVYEVNSGQWTKKIGLGTTSSHDTSLAFFNGKLYCVFRTGDNRIHYSIFDTATNWSPVYAIDEKSWGVVALVTRYNQLHMIWAENDSDRAIRDSVYDPVANKWSRYSKLNESSAYGAAGASENNRDFVAFQSNNGKGDILVCENDLNSWRRAQGSTGNTSADTPGMTVLNGRVYLCFNARNDKRTLLWISSPTNTWEAWNWMKYLPSDNLISSFTIPGTHDSGAYKDTNIPWVQAQYMDLTTQLNAGIRFFDFRAAKNDDGVLMLVHGDHGSFSDLHVKLSDAFMALYKFISVSTTEGLCVMIKDEQSQGVSFSNAVWDLMQSNAYFWRFNDTTPRLSEIRGKIQLIRRFEPPQTSGNITRQPPFGVDVYDGWNGKGPETFSFTTPTGISFTVQDNYTTDDWDNYPALVDFKMNKLITTLDQASKDPNKANWYVSLSSAYEAFNKLIYNYTANQVATGHWGWTGVNEKFYQNSSTRPALTRLGAILMDYPETPAHGLIASLIQTNFTKPQLVTKSAH